MRLGGGVELTYVGGRSFAHDGHQPLDRLQDARHTPKCQRRRAESNDLPVVGPLEPPDNMNRVGCGLRIVEGFVESIERGAQLIDPHAPV